MLERFVEALKVGFRPLLRPEIAADGGNVHGLAVPRIVDPERIDEKRYRLACLEMLEIEFAQPSAGPQHGGPAFLTCALFVAGGDKVKDIPHGKVVAAGKHDKLEPGGAYELEPAIQGRKRGKCGRAPAR